MRIVAKNRTALGLEVTIDSKPQSGNFCVESERSFEKFCSVSDAAPCGSSESFRNSADFSARYQ